jgi:hypothetical protein
MDVDPVNGRKGGQQNDAGEHQHDEWGRGAVGGLLGWRLDGLLDGGDVVSADERGRGQDGHHRDDQDGCYDKAAKEPDQPECDAEDHPPLTPLRDETRHGP